MLTAQTHENPHHAMQAPWPCAGKSMVSVLCAVSMAVQLLSDRHTVGHRGSQQLLEERLSRAGSQDPDWFQRQSGRPVSGGWPLHIGVLLGLEGVVRQGTSMPGDICCELTAFGRCAGAACMPKTIWI